MNQQIHGILRIFCSCLVWAALPKGHEIIWRWAYGYLLGEDSPVVIISEHKLVSVLIAGVGIVAGASFWRLVNAHQLGIWLADLAAVLFACLGGFLTMSLVELVLLITDKGNLP